MRKTLLILWALLHAGPAGAQEASYAELPARDIAALSDEEVRQLLDGAGMGYALAAELNGMPGPRHVLDLADSLHLTTAQRDGVRGVFARMQNDARRLGAAIVERERELDRLFDQRAADPVDVASRTRELGELYGQLRGVHLNAHIETAHLLRDHQVARYRALRGYDDTSPTTGHDAHH